MKPSKDRTGDDAGRFECKDAFIIVKKEGDAFNVNGVEYKNGNIMTFNDASLEFVNEIKEKFRC